MLKKLIAVLILVVLGLNMGGCKHGENGKLQLDLSPDCPVLNALDSVFRADLAERRTITYYNTIDRTTHIDFSGRFGDRHLYSNRYYYDNQPTNKVDRRPRAPDHH